MNYTYYTCIEQQKLLDFTLAMFLWQWKDRDKSWNLEIVNKLVKPLGCHNRNALEFTIGNSHQQFNDRLGIHQINLFVSHFLKHLCKSIGIGAPKDQKCVSDCYHAINWNWRNQATEIVISFVGQRTNYILYYTNKTRRDKKHLRNSLFIQTCIWKGRPINLKPKHPFMLKPARQINKFGLRYYP